MEPTKKSTSAERMREMQKNYNPKEYLEREKKRMAELRKKKENM